MPGPSYTKAQLQALNLPGFTTPLPEQFDPSIFTNSDWQPVFNASIISMQKQPGAHAEAAHILTTIRTKANNTHPDVVSTPTRRIYDKERVKRLVKEGSLQSWNASGQLKSASSGEIDTKETLVVAEGKPRPVRMDDTSAVAQMARTLITDKLGGERFNYYEHFPGIASLGPITIGFAYVGDNANKEPLFEPLMMFGGIINVKDPTIFPAQTIDYRGVGWAPLKDFGRGVSERNVHMLAPSATQEDQVFVCAHGQCLAATLSSTRNPHILAEHLSIGEHRLR